MDKFDNMVASIRSKIDSSKKPIKEDEESGWGRTRDGWDDKGDLDEVGLIDMFDRTEKLAYDVRNCRRGAYCDAIRGGTLEDLGNELENLARGFQQVADAVAEHYGEEGAEEGAEEEEEWPRNKDKEVW